MLLQQLQHIQAHMHAPISIHFLSSLRILEKIFIGTMQSTGGRTSTRV